MKQSRTERVQKIVWNELVAEQLTPTLARRMAAGTKLMICQISLKRGATVPLHQHVHEQVAYLLSGRLRFWFGTEGEEVHEIGSGESLIIPSNRPHRVEALEDSENLDIFAPPREDWLAGTDDYLRQR